MRFKIITSVSIVCVLAMFFGMLMFSVDNEGGSASKEKAKKVEAAKTASVEKCSNQEIIELITNFTKAKQEADMETLKNCVNDISQYNENDLKEQQTLTESVNTDNIECYTIDGLKEDTFVVYVKYYYKVKEIEKELPNLVRHFVRKNENGKFCVYTGKVYESENSYIAKTEENPDVKKLIDGVNQEIATLRSEDKMVEALYVTIEKETAKGSDKKKTKEDKKEDSSKSSEENNSEGKSSEENNSDGSNSDGSNSEGNNSEENNSEGKSSEENNSDGNNSEEQQSENAN